MLVLRLMIALLVRQMNVQVPRPTRHASQLQPQLQK
jgi:hypothetical protein